MASNELSTIDTVLEGERELLARALAGDGASLHALTARYARLLFSYLLNLSDCSRDMAYGKTAELLAGQLAERRPEDAEWFLVDCLRAAVELARKLPARPSFDASGSGEPVPPERAASRRFLKQALEQLTFEDKAFLLLRDQLCLPYAVIGRVFEAAERDARVRVERARLTLREALEGILRGREGAL